MRVRCRTLDALQTWRRNLYNAAATSSNHVVHNMHVFVLARVRDASAAGDRQRKR